MLLPMKWLFPLLLILAFEAHAALRWELPAEAWNRPRGGEMVTHLAAVRQAVERWMERPGTRLLIRHPGGEEGQLWAEELRDWLVALGVPGNRLELQAGLAEADRMVLSLEAPPAQRTPTPSSREATTIQ